MTDGPLVPPLLTGPPVEPRSVPEDLYASWGPSLSPSCDRVAFVSDRSGAPEVWVMSMAGGSPTLVPLHGHRVTAVSWSPTGEWLACSVAPPGASRTEVWVVRPDGTDGHLVAGGESVTAVVAEGRSRGWTAAGHLVVTQLGSGSIVLLVDPHGAEPAVLLEADDLTVALDVTPDGRRLLLRHGPRSARDCMVFDVDTGTVGAPLSPRSDGGSTEHGCLSPDGKVAHLATDADRDHAALVSVSVDVLDFSGAIDGLGAAGAQSTTGGANDVDASVTGGSHAAAAVSVTGRPDADDVDTPVDGRPDDAAVSVTGRPDGELEAVALSEDGSVAALTWNVEGGRSALTLLEVSTGRQHAVVTLPRPVVDGCTLSSDGSLLVLSAVGPTDPHGVWLLDTAAALAHGPTGGVGLVPVSSPGVGPLRASDGASAGSINPSEVVLPMLVGLRSADGTPISGWLYSPGAVGAFPTLIWLHGGPEAQSRPAYNSLFQSLLAEGIAVFAPNVRGSTGQGRAFRHADDGAGRYGAFEDVAACAEHLIEIGIAEPGRLGVSGRSYGGYLTLAALVRYPDLFAVGVDVCGMSDLLTFYATTEPWIADAAVSKYGHPEADRDLLRDLSPMTAIDRLRAPLLIVHGADDTNVPVSESEQLAAALAARGVHHRLLVFEGEGHELLATRSRVEFVHAVVSWVSEHLSEPEAGLIEAAG